MTALKNIASLIGGAAVLAAATIGLSAGIAGAERVWDIGEYDDCMRKTIRDVDACCIMSGGEVSESQGCVAPAAMQVPQDPGSVPTRINTGTLPTVATDAPATTAPGSRAPGRVPSGGVAAP
ncbi:hypothetical protein [Mycolicibacterium tusciae]|uniref:hypothetical protein n=1 Tax=Mycolicibacterium tusciae TaxID=75922 RepID=UPI00024A29A5|nr:hypothetical protein [Mycolicibacterium tusciae]